jgi:flagellar hook assembly protein FlgD
MLYENNYNMNGRLIKSFFKGQLLPKGIHSIEWNGTDNDGNFVSSGSYFFKMTSGNFTDLKKAIFIK